MVDTSGSQRRVLDAERGASLHFLDRVVRPVDRVFIMQFDTVVQVRQPLTHSIGKLDDSLAYVDTETKSQVRAREGGGTLLYDAIVRAAYDVMRTQSGRKALIVLSDGVDFGSENTLQDALDTAQRADTLIYSDPLFRPRSLRFSRRHRRQPRLAPPVGRKRRQLFRSFQETSSGRGVRYSPRGTAQSVQRGVCLRQASHSFRLSHHPTGGEAEAALLPCQARRQYWAQR